MNPRTKPHLERILQKTYDYHGVERQPFGYDSLNDKCLYRLECAVGLSLPKELRESVNKVDVIGLVETYPTVRQALFKGQADEIGAEEREVLYDLQQAHDQCARTSDHLTYMRRVEGLARGHGLTLTLERRAS